MQILRRLLAGRDLITEVRLAIKMVIGGTGAWWIATEFGAKRPIFAALVPLVAMTGDPFAAVSVSVGRILGVFAGVGIGVAVTELAIATTWRVAIALSIATLLGIVLKVGDRPNLEVPISALFLIGFASANVSQLAVQRIWETGIGAIVAVVVSAILWPPDPIRELERRLDRLQQQLAADFTAMADDIATGSAATTSCCSPISTSGSTSGRAPPGTPARSDGTSPTRMCTARPWPRRPGTLPMRSTGDSLGGTARRRSPAPSTRLPVRSRTETRPSLQPSSASFWPICGPNDSAAVERVVRFAASDTP
jgi:hypothetical protein